MKGINFSKVNKHNFNPNFLHDILFSNCNLKSSHFLNTKKKLKVFKIN